MLNILQAKLQQYVNRELPDIKLDLEKVDEPEIKLSTSVGSLKSKRVPQTYLVLLHWPHQSHWLGRSQKTVENSERVGNIRPPYLPPEKSVCRSRRNRTGHGTTDWFQIGKGIHQGCILSPAYLTISFPAGQLLLPHLRF